MAQQLATVLASAMVDALWTVPELVGALLRVIVQEFAMAPHDWIVPVFVTVAALSTVLAAVEDPLLSTVLASATVVV